MKLNSKRKAIIIKFKPTEIFKKNGECMKDKIYDDIDIFDMPGYKGSKNKIFKVMIVHSYSNDDIIKSRFGGSRLIYEQKLYLEKRGFDVDLLSLENVGLMTAIFYRLSSYLRREKSILIDSMKKNGKRRWFLNAFMILFLHQIITMDSLFIKKSLKKREFSAVIYNYPVGASVFYNILKKNGIPFILYEHNIEWLFFSDKIGRNMLNLFIKNLELRCLKLVDKIFVTNIYDKRNLEFEGISPQKISIWVPMNEEGVNRNSVMVSNAVITNLKNKFVVGFLGSNFEPNIIAVKNILKMAPNLYEKNIVFLIIGNVNEAFKNKKIPKNVIFAGYVDVIESYLSLCDAYINPKTTSDTGIEIKMFDYLKFNKPIITTEIGARGFENFKDTIITSIDEFSDRIKDIISEQ